MKVSRAVEHNLDREEADFALNVSSPGLDRPFMVVRQYENNVGRNLKVTFNDESRKGLEGMLIQADEEGIVLETSEKVRIEGKKKKELVVTEHPVPYTEIKAAKVVISFK
jgi:ribosome maturation factor RimP